ncbi:MAG: signal peptidase I [Defluviitaleaceae bacterium]|nr:signal peptidase I [Defluviitaleaceae bacterium]
MIDPKKPPKIYYKPVVKAPVVKEDDTPDVKKELWQEALSWAKTIILTLLLAFAINNFVIVNALVPSGSMEDTIMTNDRIVAFRLSYLFRPPQRFDMVVFRGPEGDPTLYVKRIIGLPGDRVIIIDGHVYINGSAVPERHDFVKGALVGNHGVPNEETGVLYPWVVPDGHFFVLGDYRTNSVDSRQWSEVFIPRGRILGRVAFRYFPGFANLMNH